MIDFYLQNEYWFAVIQLVLAMLGMGATLQLSDFAKVVRQPKAVSVGLTLQLVLVPLIAYGFIAGAGIVGGVAVGIALIAAIPGGSVSNIFTYFARGHTALSITLTAVTAVACLVTTPIILGLLIADAMPPDFSMPAARIAFEIGVCLLIPLAVGMVYLRVLPQSAQRFSKWNIRASLFVILLIVIGSLGAGRLDLPAFGYHNAELILGFILALTVMSWLIPKVLKLSTPDVTAIEMEVVIRNVNLGLLINASLFPSVDGQSNPVGNTVLLSLLMFGGLQLLIGGALIPLRKRISFQSQNLS